MAKADFSLRIDRRRFLTSAAAAATATGILPGVKRAHAAARTMSLGRSDSGA